MNKVEIFNYGIGDRITKNYINQTLESSSSTINKLNEDSNKAVRNINRILRKNRRILSNLNPHGKSKVHLIQLAELGFNFHYFTNIYTTKKGLQYIFCYDMGYREIENNEYLLVHKQEYVS